jgi:hypothetical protein
LHPHTGIPNGFLASAHAVHCEGETVHLKH